MVSSQVTLLVRPRTRELVSSGLGLGPLPFQLPLSDQFLVAPSRQLDLASLDFPGRWGSRTCFLEGPSAQLLAEGTLLNPRVGLVGRFLGSVLVWRSRRLFWVGLVLLISPYLAAP